MEDNSKSQEIVQYCNNDITTLGLSNKVTFISKNIRILDYKKAGKYLNDKTDVIVWTKYQKNLLDRVSIHFTYKDTENHLAAKMVHAQFSSLFSQEKMFILNKRTLDGDLEIEKGNIEDFSLYIVGICTTLFRGIDDGIFVFEKLYQKLENGNFIFKKAVSEKLVSLYLIKGNDLIQRGKYQKAYQFLEKAYILDKNNADLLSSLALVKFFLGDVSEAEEISANLLENHTGHPIAHLDTAFFRVRNKKYKSALIHYLLFSKTNPHPAIVLDAINFLSKRFDENSSELGYLFAVGFLKRILNKYHPELTNAGKTNYKEDFTSFISRANPKIYLDMITVSNKYLSK